MLAIADTTLDFLILELIPHAAVPALFLLLFLAVFLPCHAGSEDDVFAHAGRVETGAGSVAFLQAEFRPRATFGNTGVDGFASNGGADTAGGFHSLAVVVEAVRDDGLGAVFVCGDLLWRKTGGIVEFFIVGPVAAVSC